MFEVFNFKPIFQKFSTFLSRLHIIKTTFRSPYLLLEVEEIVMKFVFDKKQCIFE